MTRVGDIVSPAETRGELIGRGWTAGDAEAALALRVFMTRACTPDLQPVQADHDYQRGALSSHDYLEQVAPEELAHA